MGLLKSADCKDHHAETEAALVRTENSFLRFDYVPEDLGPCLKRALSYDSFMRKKQRDAKIMCTLNEFVAVFETTRLSQVEHQTTDQFPYGSGDAMMTPCRSEAYDISKLSSLNSVASFAKDCPLPSPPTRTTLMVRNIPIEYTQEMLVDEWQLPFDFLYLPCSLASERNLTYAFINFKTETIATEFKEIWHKRRLRHCAARKTLNVSFSSVQGRDACIWLFKQKRDQKRSKGAKRTEGKAQPIVYFGGRRVAVDDAIRDLEHRIRNVRPTMLGQIAYQ
jgi:hypothetical protein